MSDKPTCTGCTTGRPVKCRGLCAACYCRMRISGEIAVRTHTPRSRPNAAGRPVRRRKPQRVVTCARCTLAKEHKARGLCAACYQKLHRTGRVEWAAPPKLPRDHWTAADLLTLKRLRADGKTVSQCAPYFPNRSYFSVRNCCVTRKILRRVPLSEVARGTAYTLNRNKNGMPGWWHRETKRQEADK